ncbi:MAG TPA: hypothetical protein ENI98_12540 [Gammaproteobacteria bacterium]|nr:hypothetical protein [Gammaproteobacteria bacterium]
MKYFTLLIFFALAGCIARPAVEVQDAAIHQAQNEKIMEAVKSVAVTGDWLVTRGYHATDALVANATGTALSHVAVYNAQSQTVVEAEGRGVHTTPLDAFVNKSYRLLVIRPRWLTPDNAGTAYASAEQLVGKDYDYLGTIGFDSPDRYYCSELAVSIYKPWQRPVEKFPDVIKPGDLYLYGRVVYDSLPREEI